MIKIQISVLFFISVVACWHLPAHAELIDFNQDFTFERMDNGFILQRNLDLQRTQTNEIIRGRDLAQRVSSFIQKTRDSLSMFKNRQLNQRRGFELTRIADDNARDTIRRNKMIQQEQRRRQREQIQALKARNRDLNQRIRDLSRR